MFRSRCSKRGLGPSLFALLFLGCAGCGKATDSPDAKRPAPETTAAGASDGQQADVPGTPRGKKPSLASLSPISSDSAEKTVRTAPHRSRRASPAASENQKDMHGRGLGFVTKDAWVAIDIPSLKQLPELWQASDLKKALDRSGCVEAIPSLAELESLALEKLGLTVPEVRHVVDEILGAHGEAVFALLDVDPARLERGGEMPLTAALFVELGDRAATVASDLAAIEREPQLRSGLGESMTKMSDDLYLLGDATIRIELMVKDSWVAVLVGPPAKYAPVLDDLAILPRKDSFLESALLRSAPRPVGESASPSPAFECYLNLGALPQILEAYAGRDTRSFVSLLGLDKIAGVSMVSAIDHGLFAEAFGLVSPGRTDILTSLFDSKALDADFARYTFEGADSATLCCFDFARAISGVRDRLPEAARAEFDSALESMNREVGMDVHRELLAMIGSNFAFSSKGSLALAVKGGSDDAPPFQAALAIELQKSDLARKFVDKLVADKTLPATPRQVGDHKAYVAPSFPGAPPWLEISFTMTEDALVVATTFDTLKQVIETADADDASKGDPRLWNAIAASPSESFMISASSTEAEIRNLAESLRQSLSETFRGEQDLAAFVPSDGQMSKLVAGLRDSVRTCSATNDGLVFDSHAPLGNPTLLALPIGIAASIALPKLMETKIKSQHASVEAHLRNLASAELEFRGNAVVDSDRDGIGEFGTIGELTGHEPSTLGPAKAWTVSNGVAQIDGYCFQVWLPGKNGIPVRESATGERNKGIDADACERQFAAYAWPNDKVSGTFQVYMIDAKGILYRAVPNATKTPFDSNAGPEGDAAFGLRESILKPAAIDKATGFMKGASGMLWAPVN